MILSTTHEIQGHNITEYLGLVAGEAMFGANIVRDALATVSNVLGGRTGAYEEVIAEARLTALHELKQEALGLGADAVVGLSISYNVGQMQMVAVLGTAVRLAR
jgi:uncharacterized protein YbjQ (UPF0145 family)